MAGSLLHKKRQERWCGIGLVLVACLVGLGPGLGSASPLTYHEALVVQAASEILTYGQWLEPTIGRLPWLEKPPLPFWVVASIGALTSHLTPSLARLPFAVAAASLAIGITCLVTRYYGHRMGILAGAIQATTGWWIFRGRLAEADILLACLVTWTLVAFDRLRAVSSVRHIEEQKVVTVGQHRFWQYVFFALLGLGALVKGTGFGAALVLSTTLTVIIWGREWQALRYLLWAPGWALTGLLAFAWPLAMISQHGTKVIGLWVLHISDRVLPPTSHGQFAGETWTCYLVNVVGQGLPWTPLAIAGAVLAAYRHHIGIHQGVLRSHRNYPSISAGHRLFWSWTIVPLLLVSVTRARNAHYAIHAMVPWSFWASIALTDMSTVLCRRGWTMVRLRQVTLGTFSLLALGYGVGYWLAGACINYHSSETAFYQHVGQTLQPGEQITLLYDEWDRDPYQTPFGQIPHDLALRLFYLRHPACWHFGVASLAAHSHTCTYGTSQVSTSSPLLIIGRHRNLKELRRLGNVEVLAYSAAKRWDRRYISLRLWPYITAAAQRPITVSGPSK